MLMPESAPTEMCVVEMGRPKRLAVVTSFEAKHPPLIAFDAACHLRDLKHRACALQSQRAAGLNRYRFVGNTAPVTGETAASISTVT